MATATKHEWVNESHPWPHLIVERLELSTGLKLQMNRGLMRDTLEVKPHPTACSDYDQSKDLTKARDKLLIAVIDNLLASVPELQKIRAELQS